MGYLHNDGNVDSLFQVAFWFKGYLKIYKLIECFFIVIDFFRCYASSLEAILATWKVIFRQKTLIQQKYAIGLIDRGNN